MILSKSITQESDLTMPRNKWLTFSQPLIPRLWNGENNKYLTYLSGWFYGSTNHLKNTYSMPKVDSVTWIMANDLRWRSAQSNQDPPERAAHGTLILNASWIQKRQELPTLCSPGEKYLESVIFTPSLCPLRRNGVTSLIGEPKTRNWAYLTQCFLGSGFPQRWGLVYFVGTFNCPVVPVAG